jgi:hypothetical protein
MEGVLLADFLIWISNGVNNCMHLVSGFMTHGYLLGGGLW